MWQRTSRLMVVAGSGCFHTLSTRGGGLSLKLGSPLKTLSTAPSDSRGTNSRNFLYVTLGLLGGSGILYLTKKKPWLQPEPDKPEPEQLVSLGEDHTSKDHSLDDESIPRSKRFNFIAEAVEKAIPAVVYVENQQWVQTLHRKKCIPVSNGSGFVVDSSGYVLTTAHVIANASQISVRLHSGETLGASLLDVDQVADLALLKLDNSRRSQKFPALRFGKSSQLRPGEWVIALGSPLSLKNTITCGIVSSLGRRGEELGLHKGGDMEYIQTDAAITVGNSGGPLVNLDGEVVGINTMTASPGISFAVPSSIAEEFIRTAQKTVPKEKPKKYGIGVSMMSLNPRIVDSLRQKLRGVPTDVQTGAYLARVWHGSPAHRAGLQVNDIIVKIDNTPITSTQQVYDIVQKGNALRIEVIRGGQTIAITVKPEPII